ncbi:MAG: 30S ribosomal protein S9 [Nitrospinae bacterium]|nr:30S ribosomal protein S9 [Nitrospinota bacterium]
MEEERYYGTGKRKTAVARVWLQPGDGNITVNRRSLNEYFGREILGVVVKDPLVLTNSVKRFDIFATVKGGGLSGQAAAIKHGIAKALLQSDPNLRLTLKRGGLLTRDSRIKERKKYGQKGARKRFQYSKR